jgi:hypothetical protein
MDRRKFLIGVSAILLPTGGVARVLQPAAGGGESLIEVGDNVTRSEIIRRDRARTDKILASPETLEMLCNPNFGMEVLRSFLKSGNHSADEVISAMRDSLDNHNSYKGALGNG